MRMSARWLGAARIPGMLVMFAGLVLLMASVWLWRQSATAQPPYRYAMDTPGQDEPERISVALGSLDLRTGRVLGEGDEQVLARFATVDSDTGPVLMRWQPAVDSPFLHMQPELGEVTELAQVMARHVEPDIPVLAWWDLSRQLALLTDAGMTFDAPIGEPLFIPSVWRSSQEQVRSVEHTFWKIPDDASQEKRFKSFVQALIMDEASGMAALQALVQGRRAVLVLHVRDMIQLGHIASDRLGVAFREFPVSGDVHGTVSGVRKWLADNDYASYAVMRTQDQSVRAVALTDAQSGMTLAARLLPFIGNAQHDVEGATLVYQIGGFSVYEIAPVAIAGE